MPSSTPGRPHEPTIHPRTRPEASDYALKNRVTNDWLRHDGKNVEGFERPPTRSGTSLQAVANAIKARGDAQTWFQHDPNAPPEPKPPRRCPTPDSKVAHDKVYGRKELWYKHDDNAHYHDPVPVRMGACGGDEIRNKFVSPEASKRSMSWYRHDHAPGDDYRPPTPKHNTGPVAQPVLDNELRVHGGGGPPAWYAHRATPDENATRPQPRVTMPEAMETWNKDRCGRTSAWFQHDSRATPAPQDSRPKVGSKEGEEIATRMARGSKNWFAHDRRDHADDGVPERRVSAAVREMLDRSNLGTMQRTMHTGAPAGGSPSPQHLAIRPEAEKNARLNTVGNMHAVFDEAANRRFVDENHGAGRVIRPEAKETFEKNKGVMAECFQGYRDQPWKKKHHKLAADDEIVLKHSGSSMEKVMKGLGPPGSGRFHAARGIRPEAEEIAERHKGSSMFDVFTAGHEDFVKKGPKVRSELALEVARKNQGYVADLIR